MRFPGTISIPEPAFEAMLEGAARLCHHGLRDVVLLGDHGGYQKSLHARGRARPLRTAAACMRHPSTTARRPQDAQALGERGYEVGRARSSMPAWPTPRWRWPIDPALVRLELGRRSTPAERPA